MSFALGSLVESVRRDFAKTLSLLPGDKIMLVDSSLLKPLDRVANMSLLRRFSVTKLFKMAENPPKSDFEKIVYMLPSDYDACMAVIKHFEIDQENEIKRTRLIIFVPKETAVVTHLLESRGFLGRTVCTASLSFGWFQLDDNLVTLNLPVLFPDYFMYEDFGWPHFMGIELGKLLKLTSQSDLAPMGCRIHAFGEVANVVAAGMRLHCIQSGLIKSVTNCNINRSGSGLSRCSTANSYESPLSSKSSLSALAAQQHPPLVFIFGRDLDYVSTLLIPMTFEALIHEVIGIELGQIELPSQLRDKNVPQKMTLDSSKMHYFKDLRDVHISHVHSLIVNWYAQLEQTRTDLQAQLSHHNVQQDESCSAYNGSKSKSLKRLVGDGLGPLLARKRELSFWSICLEHVLNEMTQKQSVEDLRTSQTLLLQSGSGNSLAIATKESNAESKKLTPMSAGGACGNLYDDLTSMPVRLAIEWLTINHGDSLLDGIRLLLLNSVVHDGLSDDAYNELSRAVLYASGHVAYPMIDALNSMGLFTRRMQHQKSTSKSGSNVSNQSVAKFNLESVIPVASNHVTTETNHKIGRTTKVLAGAVTRLKLNLNDKSRYNYVHHLLQLSHQGQTNRSATDQPISSTYVYSGEHCPIIARLVESIWALGIEESHQPGGKSSLGYKSPANGDMPSISDQMAGGSFELINRSNLSEALKRLGLNDEVCSNLGLLNLFNPSLTAAGYQNDIFENKQRPNAPNPRPLPLLRSEQPVVVVFPGGCSYGEVAALRFVAQRHNWHLLIATSCMLNSRDILQQISQSAVHTNSG